MKPAEVYLVIREAKKYERERCAKLAERKAKSMGNGEGELFIARAIAKAIRKLR